MHIKIAQVVKSLSVHKLYYILETRLLILVPANKIHLFIKIIVRVFAVWNSFRKNNIDWDPFKNKGLCWKYTIVIESMISFA